MQLPRILVVAAFAGILSICSAQSPTEIVVSAQPLNNGRISPMLFGNFMELLDDLVPGMWAEMLNDRSFEGVTHPANWCYYDGALNLCDREWDKNSTWTYETAHPFNGARSAILSAARKHPAAISQSGLAVKKGQAYLFSGHFKTEDRIRAKVILKSLLPDGKWMELASTEFTPAKGSWTKYSAQLVAKGTTDRAVFELQLSGVGSATVDKLSLMSTNNLRGWRPDVIAAMKDSHPSVVRWGGSVCDPGGYRWKNGIGERDLRTPFPNKVWGRIDPNDVGIDEFCDFCELVGAQPLVCLSFSDGAANATDLVEYCNGNTNTTWGAKRAINGHAKPYRIKYWQIGNEIGGDNPDYLEKVVAFCQTMKKTDPSIVCLASFPSQKLLDRAGEWIDYIGPHHYTPDFGACESDFKKLSQMIDTTPKCSHIKIAVTEWNVSAGSWGLMRGKFLTLETALLNAKYLNLLMRHADKAEIACRSNMANSIGSGVIETTPSGLLKRPSYYVMKLYADHTKPLPLSVEQSPDGIDVMACGSEDGKTAVVFAVNSKNTPVPISLHFNEAKASHIKGGEVFCDTRDERQIDVMNHWEAPDRMRNVPVVANGDSVILPAYSAAAIECALEKN